MGKKDLIEFILNTEKQGAVSLLYGARDEKFNNAIALKSYIESKQKESIVELIHFTPVSSTLFFPCGPLVQLL